MRSTIHFFKSIFCNKVSSVLMNLSRMKKFTEEVFNKLLEIITQHHLLAMTKTIQ